LSSPILDAAEHVSTPDTDVPASISWMSAFSETILDLYWISLCDLSPSKHWWAHMCYIHVYTDRLKENHRKSHVQGYWYVRSPTRRKETIERSPFFVRRGGHCCRRDLVGRTTFWIFFEWLAKVRVWSL